MKPKKKIVMSWPKQHQHPISVRHPGTGYPYWRRLILGPGDKATVISLSHSVLCYHCHYLSGTYVPCLWDCGQDCEHHGQESSPRYIYQGSLPVLRMGDTKVWLLNPTSSALHSGLKPLEEREDLLGAMLYIERGPGGRNARMKVRVGDRAHGAWEGKAIPHAEIWRVQMNVWCVELEPREFSNGQALPNERGPEEYPPLE